jgi:hypothetical protein
LPVFTAGRPLTWQLWVVFAVTVLVLPFAFFVMEKLNLEGFLPLSNSTLYDQRFALCELACCLALRMRVPLLPVTPPALLQTVISWPCSLKSEAAAC